MDRKFVINQVDIVSSEVTMTSTDEGQSEASKAIVRQSNANSSMLAENFFDVANELKFNRPETNIRFEVFHLEDISFPEDE